MACPTCDRVRQYLNRAWRDSEDLLLSQGLGRDQIDPLSGDFGILNRMSFANPTFQKVAMEGVKAVRRNKPTKKQRTQRKHMSTAMKQTRDRATKKNGEWKKGWDQSRCMKEAHKLAKRLCK